MEEPSVSATVTDAAGKDWTFHLIPGGKWSDGTPLTAEDAAKGYKALALHPPGSTFPVHADIFKHLYDKTTPSPFPDIKILIERELERPLKEVFAEFSETPIASASVGQVHFATLRTGEKVAVKVQHPGIEERVAVDFEIMEPMVRFVENLFAASRVWQPREHLLEIQAMLLQLMIC